MKLIFEVELCSSLTQFSLISYYVFRLLVEEQRRREEVEKRHLEEEVKRRHQTRLRVIQELVQTEKDYLRSITVCHDTFFDPDFPRVSISI